MGIPGQFLHGILEFIQKKPHHPHAVFKLQIAVIGFLGREIPSCHQIPLVACMDKMDPVLFINLLLESMNQGKNLPGVLRRKGFQWIKPLSVPGKPYGHHGHALKHRYVFHEPADTKGKLLFVIDSSAEHNLPVHGDPGFIKAVRFF